MKTFRDLLLEALPAEKEKGVTYKDLQCGIFTDKDRGQIADTLRGWKRYGRADVWYNDKGIKTAHWWRL